ncbi:hypothetical protein N2K95_05665 [Arthrobacter zhaoxinii]|uniref:Lytic transglycosylase domain-containing protein n=1 Tax=Arthrobacter zhaoxinii TaxID=2964616 RepID=A0ABY5YTK8_9MICC|nr:hypothetical protein [Arthrobacter zhaoxinii]UWX98147.1 hypothetical protein N2K95_05665 [Arthrobacter zhaoxinii]
MSSPNFSRRDLTRIRRARRRSRRLRLGAATALGSLAAAGVCGASLGTAGANLRATAGIQLVNLADPLLAGYDSAADPAVSSADGPDIDAAAEPLAEPGTEESEVQAAAKDTGTAAEAAAKGADAAAAAADVAAAAAARKQAEAEAAAQQAAEEAAARAAVPVDDPAAAKAYAAAALPARGWEAAQLTCLDKLWTKESEWLTSAVNPDSGAYGIAQSLPAEKMAVAGDDWKVSYSTQINWGLDYIASRYGSPCTALNFHYANNWY